MLLKGVRRRSDRLIFLPDALLTLFPPDDIIKVSETENKQEGYSVKSRKNAGVLLLAAALLFPSCASENPEETKPDAGEQMIVTEEAIPGEEY